MTIHLTAQSCNSLPYHCHMNVFLTLIPNSTKVKQILKNQPLLELDGIEYKYLFGVKFKEKLRKITTAKQKSKTILTGLQKSSTSAFPPSHKPFRAGPLSQSNQQGAPWGRGWGGSLFQRASFRRVKSYS